MVEKNGGGEKPNKTENKQTVKCKAKSNNVGPKNEGCFWCGGPHFVRKCPHKNEVAEEEQMDSTQFLDPLKANEATDVSSRKKKTEGGLMYVKAKVNGGVNNAMIVTGTTNNLLAEDEAARLGIKVTKEAGWFKAVDAEPKPIVGVAKRVPMQLADWRGEVNLTVILMNDHKMVLGMEFFKGIEMVTIQNAGTMIITQGKVTFEIPILHDNTKSCVLSAVKVFKVIEEDGSRGTRDAFGVPTLCMGRNTKAIYELGRVLVFSGIDF
ncbi:uncharacterized protein LOC127259245 [Andrographis paniculata]|uniref:uncharacterized protein LOC127259245 n=1 Tax=Andrographis paniculata TaxID=175694 RepID=UPI0021E7BC26|nr:uncharacterized protein LOC127259245 [Andrographis paniculata]XP_051142391.1 uncharacterized protein LOC127259245 [Andrographis paniculata]XP_051142392.1 uncharacterized protein LOC127259245 [Andrographis paniculata]XP_051142393.1 uncharacterized protein LOC127259245 [Andrographis paniculata]